MSTPSMEGSNEEKLQDAVPESNAPSAETTRNFDDWDSPDDPENPLNWSMQSKMFHSTLPSLVALVSTGAAPIYLPARVEIVQKLHVSTEVSLLPYCLFVAGLALGPILAAPMSETIGRRPVYLVGVPLSALFLMGSGLSNNIAALCICRFLAGALTSPGLTNGAGTIADVWRPAQRAIPFALFATCPFVGPSLAPIVGAALTSRFDWRWTEWLPIILLAAIYVCVLFMKETYKKIILKKRALHHGAAPVSPPLPVSVFVTVVLIRPIEMLFVEPIVGLFSLWVAFNFAMLYAFFAAFPYVYSTVYHMDNIHQGLVWLSGLVGVFIATATFIAVSLKTQKYVATRSKPSLPGYRREVTPGVPVPEDRLYSAMLGSVGMPVSLFWFAWTARSGIHPMVSIVSISLFAWAQVLVFMTSILYVSDVYGAMYTASALAAGIFSRQLLGAVFPLFTIQMYRNLTPPWASSLLGFISVALSLIPWGFYILGPRFRSTTKYALTAAPKPAEPVLPETVLSATHAKA